MLDLIKGLFAPLLFALAGAAAAQQAKSLDQLNAEGRYDTAIAALENLRVMVERMSAEKRMDCEKAFGNQAFCDCIVSNTPVVFSFAQYVAITTRTKEQNGYAKLSVKDKEAYDMVPRVRDTCVKAAR